MVICVPMFCALNWRATLNENILELVARVVEWCEPPGDSGRGHPPAKTVRVLAICGGSCARARQARLRRACLPRIASRWHSLRATTAQASGSTLRRRLVDWAEADMLRHVHSMLVGMLRSQPDLARDPLVDSCSVRAKRGGELARPNPTDRAMLGTKYHVAVNGDGLPVACVATAANVNDTLMFERLFRLAQAVMVQVRTAFADKGYDAESNRGLASGTAQSRASASAASRTARASASVAGRWSAPARDCWKTSASPCPANPLV